MHQANVSDLGRTAEAAFTGAPLEYYSPELMGLLVSLWRDIDDPEEDAAAADLANYVAGVAAGIEFSHPVYGQVSCKAAALADLEALETVLVMRGRLG